MKRPLLLFAVLLGASLPPNPAAAQERTVAWQVAVAVLPLPDSMRAGAEVLGYRAPGGPLVPLRAGTNDMICLTDSPDIEGYAANCYHKSLAAFMLRGRVLRAAGITKRPAVDSARLAEITAGTLKMPKGPATLYSLYADSVNFDPAAGRPTGARTLISVYVPYATEASSGIPTQPATDRPWLMYAGKPWAHLMIQ
jgi:hypothetical protein